MMRLLSPGVTPPADVDKYLLPHEQQVITVRTQPAVLLGPVILAVAGLVTAIVLSSERLLVVKGVLARDISMIPLTMVKGLKFRRTFIGRLFGYGQFIVDA